MYTIQDIYIPIWNWVFYYILFIFTNSLGPTVEGSRGYFICGIYFRHFIWSLFVCMCLKLLSSIHLQYKPQIQMNVDWELSNDAKRIIGQP